MALHSNIGASSAERWWNCPGSVALCSSLPPSPTSVNAAQGTVAHSLCEMALKGKSIADLNKMVGQVVKEDGHEIEIDEQMVDAAINYRDTILSDMEELRLYTAAGGKEPELLVEQRVTASSADEHAYGTSDAIVYQKGKKLIVYDFKYGTGVVEAVGNKQMQYYAVGAMDTLKCWAFEEVEMVIIQPRARHVDGEVRRWVVPLATIKEFAANLKLAIARTRLENAETKAGAWCRWCSAKAQCPAMFNAAQAQAGVDFAIAPASTIDKGATQLKEVSQMSVEQMAAALHWEEAIDAWFKAIRERAKTMLQAGEEVPGYKLVDGKTNRKWKDEKEVVKEFGAVLGEDQMFEKKLLSPAKLEKIIGKGKLDDFTYKPEASKTLAPDMDPRPVTRSSAVEDFSVVTQLEDTKETDSLKGLL